MQSSCYSSNGDVLGDGVDAGAGVPPAPVVRPGASPTYRAGSQPGRRLLPGVSQRFGCL